MSLSALRFYERIAPSWSAQGRAHRVHRLRVPLARPLPTRQPDRAGGLGLGPRYWIGDRPLNLWAEAFTYRRGMADRPRPFALHAGGGERLGDVTILVRSSAAATAGAFSLFEEVPPMADTPLHVHEKDDELFYVLEGEHVFQVGEDELRVGPGGLVFAPRGVPHAQRRVVPGQGRLLVLTVPGASTDSSVSWQRRMRQGRSGPRRMRPPRGTTGSPGSTDPRSARNGLLGDHEWPLLSPASVRQASDARSATSPDRGALPGQPPPQSRQTSLVIVKGRCRSPLLPRRSEASTSMR